jgi:cytochrome c oxidase subunit 2
MSEGANGEQIVQTLGCVACHSNDGSDGIGPTWKNTYGTNRSLTSGEAVVIDDNYIKNSIVNPMSQVAQGYAPVMPAYATLSEEELNAITDYIKTLSE